MSRPDTHRIEHDVSADLEQIAVPIDHNRLEPTLQHVADPTVTPVEELGIDTVELAHGLRQISLGRFTTR